MGIGRVEGQARIWEQRAKLCRLLAMQPGHPGCGGMIERGLDACRRSVAIFRMLGDRVGEGRLDAIADSLRALRAT